jgi:hypothetical protein
MKSLLLLCIPIFTYGQTSTDLIENKAIYLKYDFASIVGDGVTNSCGVQLGLEFEMNDNIGFEQDLMYIFTADWQNNGYYEIEVEKVNGLKSITELRFYRYSKDNRKLKGPYVAPNLIFQYTEATREAKDENHAVYSYNVGRFVFALHGKFGYQSKLYRKIYFDLACGPGIRYISSKSQNKKISYSTTYEFPYSKDYDTGSEWFLSINFSFKIAYKF